MAQQHEEIPLHDGQMLRMRVAQSPLRPADIARHMNTAHSTLLGYYETANLRSDVIQRASLALGRNLFFDLGMRLPEGLPSALDTAPLRRLAELEAENAHMLSSLARRIQPERYTKWRLKFYEYIDKKIILILYKEGVKNGNS